VKAIQRFTLKILDWYILREYVKLFLLCFAFFAALAIVVILLDKEISRLLDKDRTIIEAIKIILYKSPGLIMRVPCVPASASLAAFFVLGRFARNNELAAMKSAGVSMYRVIFLMGTATFIICILAGIFNDRIASPAAWRARLLEKRIPYYINRDIIFKGKGDRMYYIQHLRLEDKRAINLRIYEFDDNNELKSEISASTATWASKTWTLKNGTVRHFANGREIACLPFDVESIYVPENPNLFAESGTKPQEMTYAALSKRVKYKRDAGRPVREELVEMHHKIAYPFAPLVVILIAAPLAIQFGRVGIAAGFLVTMFLSFIYWGIATAIFEALGVNGKLPPVIACWAANILFAAIGGIAIWKVPK
jgi:lipopolysaccharide export system permease protein